MANGTVTPGGVETDVVVTTNGSPSGYLEAIIFLDTMQAGDAVTIRIYRWNATAGAWQLSDDETLSGAQTYKAYELSGMYVNGTMRARLTIVQTAGTNRTFRWESEVAG